MHRVAFLFVGIHMLPIGIHWGENFLERAARAQEPVMPIEDADAVYDPLPQMYLRRGRPCLKLRAAYEVYKARERHEALRNPYGVTAYDMWQAEPGSLVVFDAERDVTAALDAFVRKLIEIDARDFA